MLFGLSLPVIPKQKRILPWNNLIHHELDYYYVVAEFMLGWLDYVESVKDCTEGWQANTHCVNPIEMPVANSVNF